jgi:hypothetical protein
VVPALPAGVAVAGNEVPADRNCRPGRRYDPLHCEIDVDDNVATQVDQVVRPAPGSTDPMNGVLACGAPLPNAKAR